MKAEIQKLHGAADLGEEEARKLRAEHLSRDQQARATEQMSGPVAPTARARQLREHFGLTQIELAHALGVSLRTVQNWDRDGVAGSPHQLRDLEELWTILKASIKGKDIPVWLGSESEAFAGACPIELLRQGKARDIVVEFRRLKAGEPV